MTRHISFRRLLIKGQVILIVADIASHKDAKISEDLKNESNAWMPGATLSPWHAHLILINPSRDFGHL